MDTLPIAPSKRLSRVDGHWLWIGGPVPPGSVGITLGALVVVRKTAARSDGFAELLAHEQVHVRQFAELGTLRFLSVYLKSYARFRLRGYGHWQAYVRIPLEIEARVDARTHLRERSSLVADDARCASAVAPAAVGASSIAAADDGVAHSAPLR